MKVLLIDDSPEIIEVVSLCFQLRWNGVQILTAGDGSRGLALVKTANPDIVVLDVGLPDINGFEVLREIRSFSQIPVIMLTVRAEDTDIARGLEMGADDYITKPFSHIELMARVQAVMRRFREPTAKTGNLPLASDRLWIDVGSKEVKVNGETARPTSTEFKLLEYMVKNEGRLLSHEKLLSQVWGDTYRDARDLLRVHVQHLRRKLGDSIESPRIIVTEHGMGYKFVRPIRP